MGITYKVYNSIRACYIKLRIYANDSIPMCIHLCASHQFLTDVLGMPYIIDVVIPYVQSYNDHREWTKLPMISKNNTLSIHLCMHRRCVSLKSTTLSYIPPRLVHSCCSSIPCFSANYLYFDRYCRLPLA